MIQRTITILIVALATNLAAMSQLVVGDWKIYTPFDGVDRVVATPDRYYYLSTGSLFSYDDKNMETVAYTTQNRLNDTEIDNIYYNSGNRYLAVAYANGNIDLLYDNGRTVNMSDIRDAVLTSSKKINYITFGQNRIYAATDFGIVIFDDQRHCVVESGIYNTAINVFTRVGDHYLIGYDNAFHYLKADRRINTLSEFKRIFYSSNVAIQTVGDNKIIGSFQVSANDCKIYSYTFDFENNSAKYEMIQDRVISRNIDPCDNGYYISGNNRLIVFDNDGEVLSNVPCDINPAAMWKLSDGIMGAYDNGLAHFNYTDNSWERSSDPINPGAITTKYADLMKFDRWGNLYISGKACSKYFNFENTARTPINRINADGTIENLEPVNLTYPINVSVPDDNKLWNTTAVTPHPTREGVFYLSNFFQGLRIHHDDEIIATYNVNNSPINQWWGCTAMETAFDNRGNLWALINYNSDPSLYFIPADKADNPSKEDWIPVSLNGFKTQHDAKILYGTKSKVIVITTSTYEAPILVYDTKGTDSTDDDTFSSVKTFIDQDGREFSAIRHPAMFEDENGKIWIGSTDGVFIINNPKAMAANPSTPVTRVKVSRNDGTNLADYLLTGETVLSIDADNANRKWIATKENGVYLVTPDGTKILEHFTTDNSPLPSNAVHSVACDPNSNSVYFGTPLGVAQYSSSSSPSMPDFSEVIAYPNPVRPEYRGWITIKGLMENSLVKIADSAGNVVFTTRSEGGMATWDGCNTAGQRVKTGVYYVFASSGSENSSTTGAVTKIMIVN